MRWCYLRTAWWWYFCVCETTVLIFDIFFLPKFILFTVIIAQRATSINKILTTTKLRAIKVLRIKKDLSMLVHQSVAGKELHFYMFHWIVGGLKFDVNSTLTNDVLILNWYWQACTCKCDTWIYLVFNLNVTQQAVFTLKFVAIYKLFLVFVFLCKWIREITRGVMLSNHTYLRTTTTVWETHTRSKIYR